MNACGIDIDWLITQPYRCYFYPGRDCPGWEPGESCGRFSHLVIPADETEQPELGPW